MKHHLMIFLQNRSPDEIAKMLNWAMNSAIQMDDLSPLETRTKTMIYSAIWQLEKPDEPKGKP